MEEYERHVAAGERPMSHDVASVGFLYIRPAILRTARYFAAALAPSAVFNHRNIFLATIRYDTTIRQCGTIVRFGTIRSFGFAHGMVLPGFLVPLLKHSPPRRRLHRHSCCQSGLQRTEFARQTPFFEKRIHVSRVPHDSHVGYQLPSNSLYASGDRISSKTSNSRFCRGSLA